MGALLAMTFGQFMKIPSAFKIPLVLSLVMGWAGCSSDGGMPMVDTFRTITTQLTTGRDPAARDARALLTPEGVAATKQPYLLVELPSRQASATRLLFNQSGAVQDWRGPDGISVILNDDVLLGTRGLGADLFAADPIPLAGWRAGPTEPYDRVYRHLDGENRELRTVYACRLSAGGAMQVDLIARTVSTRHILETCIASDPEALPVVNEYWIGTADNVVWKSKQWVSDSIQFVTITHLVR